MNNIKNKKKELMSIPNFFSQLFLIFIVIYQIKSEITECPREFPILISNECKLEYCNKTQFDSNYCQIKNSTIKTQWLNNIIKFGDITYRYINVASYSNGDIVFETTCIPASTKRMFYGVKQNGRPFFKNKTNNNEETHYYSKEIISEKELEGQFETDSIIIKNSNTGKEYFLSVSKLYSYAEMYDFDNDEVYFKLSSSFSGNIYIRSYRNTFFSFLTKENEMNYYYFFGFIGVSMTEHDFKVFFQKHIFRDLDDFENITTLESSSEQLNGYGNEISCFQTSNLE